MVSRQFNKLLKMQLELRQAWSVEAVIPILRLSCSSVTAWRTPAWIVKVRLWLGLAKTTSRLMSASGQERTVALHHRTTTSC